MDGTLLRQYDQALCTKLGFVDQPDGTTMRVAVPGIPATVAAGFGLPEDYLKTWETTGISVRRLAVMPDPARYLPGFKAQEVSTNPATPHTINIQAVPSLPVKLLYQIRVHAPSQHVHNALVAHLITKLPTQGFGTVLPVGGRFAPFFLQGTRDRTEVPTETGKLLVQDYSYLVEAWLVSLECEKVKQILTIEQQLEVHATATKLTPATPEPTDPDLITVLPPIHAP